MELSRRSFLIGSAAFVAIAGAGASVLPRPPVISSATLNPVFPWRSINDIMFGFVEQPEAVVGDDDEIAMATGDVLAAHDRAAERICVVSVRRTLEGPALLQRGLSTRGTWRWVAVDALDSFIVTEGAGIILDVDPGLPGAFAQILYNVERDPNKRRRSYVENFTWNGPGNVVGSTPMALDPRDQLDEPEPPRPSLLRRFFGWRKA